jgi:tetratricopeptide (TPR) repeat protein
MGNIDTSITHRRTRKNRYYELMRGKRMKPVLPRLFLAQIVRMILPASCIVLAVLGTVSLPASAEYTQGWLYTPDYILERMDTSSFPDIFIPKNLSGQSEPVPTVTSYVDEGNDLLASSSFEAAKRSFDGAIGLNPRSFDAWIGKGSALEGLKRYQSALDSYDEAIGLSHNKVKAWAAYAGKARILYELQQYQAAGDAYAKAISMFDRSKSGTHEEFMNLYLGLAKAKEAVGDEAEASYARGMADELGAGYTGNSSS